jgi:alkanesulfonate monooxygenase SsuD/methylene tetrahydromethanopterin reductase-like flavin-dependent oxidoreductase (luciferase family)
VGTWERGRVCIRIQVPSFTWPDTADGIGSKLAEIGRTADEAGVASLWVMDHFFQIEYVGPAEDPMLEGYNAQSYPAGITERVRLGTLVTGVIYRYTGILLKTATTLDVLSGGRAYLGIGAGCSSARREVWASPSPRQKNASSAWRRTGRSPTRCGQAR